MSTNNNIFTIDLTNLTKEEITTIAKIKAASIEREEKVWKPKYKKTYFYIDDESVYEDYWYDINLDEERYKNGNCFRIYEEAEFEIERRKVETELKHFAQMHNDKNCNNVWNISYDKHDKVLKVQNWLATYIMPTYFNFTSKEIAQQAIEEIGAERIIKYFFGIQS